MQAEKEKIRSILLPLGEGNLLLPHSSMVEIIPAREVEVLVNSAEWVLGSINWNNETIPLLGLEMAFGSKKNIKPKRTRLIIIPSLLGDHGYRYLAIQTTGVPTLVQLADDSIENIDNVEFNRQYIQCCGLMNGRVVIVPDMNKLESDLLLKDPTELTVEV